MKAMRLLVLLAAVCGLGWALLPAAEIGRPSASRQSAPSGSPTTQAEPARPVDRVDPAGPAAAPGAVPSAVTSAPPAVQPCDRARLGRALAADTTRLRRTAYEGPAEESSEGESVTFFLEGQAPRVVVVTAYGEMGYSQERYYLADPASFVVEREEVRYAEPFYEGEPRIASRDRQVAYVCDGRALAPDEGLGARAPGRLRAALAHLPRATPDGDRREPAP